MNRWIDLLTIVREEAGDEIAAKIEKRARNTMGGERLTVLRRMPSIPEEVHNAAPGRPRTAARKLGIHPTTAYRALKRMRTVR